MKIRFLLLPLVLCTVPSGFSQNVTQIVDSPSANYDNSGASSSQVLIASDTGNFQTAYSMVDASVLTISVTAPKGKVIRVTAPAGFDVSQLRAFCRTVGAESTDAIVPTTTGAFIRPTGYVPTLVINEAYLSTTPGDSWSTRWHP